MKKAPAVFISHHTFFRSAGCCAPKPSVACWWASCHYANANANFAPQLFTLSSLCYFKLISSHIITITSRIISCMSLLLCFPKRYFMALSLCFIFFHFAIFLLRDVPVLYRYAWPLSAMKLVLNAERLGCTFGTCGEEIASDEIVIRS